MTTMSGYTVIGMDFSRVCRACKTESGEMRLIFEEVDVEGHRIDEMLMSCAQVQINPNDGLPTLICNKCLDRLEAAFAFKRLIEGTDQNFRSFVKQLKDTHTDLFNDLQQVLGFQPEAIIKEENGEPPMEKCDFIEITDANQMILTCRQCYKIFTTLDGLKCHKRVHGGTLFKCKTCQKEYTRLNHLQRHELTHGKRKVHVCKICNKTLTRFEHLKRHLIIHLKEKPFTCLKCSRGFNRSEHLVSHVNRCKGDRIHICDICNKGFNRTDSLDVHRKMHENKMPVLPTLENLDNIEEHYIEIDHDEAAGSVFDEDDPDDEDFNSDPTTEALDTEDKENSEEDKEFEDEGETIEEIQEHIKREMASRMLSESSEQIEEIIKDFDADVDYDDYRSESGESECVATKRTTKRKTRPPKTKDESDEEFDCTICEEKFNDVSSLEKHASDVHGDVKLFECQTCGKSFARQNHLSRHLVTHSVIKPYVCDLCPKAFNRKDHLAQHLKLHTRPEQYECNLCARHFNRYDHLQKHKAIKHSAEMNRSVSEKKFNCTLCTKSFTSEKYRDSHMRTHNEDKKFKCKTCDKTFLSKSHLSEHMKFHNENSKKFLCSECGQRFIRNDYLVIHMRRHRGEKPFKCKYCGKGFPRTTDLTVHERYHTGEKTHLCVICGRGFGRAYNLTVHMRTHTGEKPYQCTYCDAAFAQGNDLKAHVRRHTGERFQCELCTETFLMGYLLTQHKRTAHGLNVVSNIRRLQPPSKSNEEDEEQPITIELPPPVIPNVPEQGRMLHAQLAQIGN